MNVLVVAEHIRGRLREVTRELITAGGELGDVTVAVIGGRPDDFAAQLDLDGVREIVTIASPAEEFDADAYRQAVRSLVEARNVEVVLLGTTANSISYGAAVAVDLGFGFAGDVHRLRIEDGSLVATRSFYGGRVHAELDFPDRPGVVLLLRPSVWEPAADAAPRSATVTPFSPELQDSRTRHIGFVEPEPSGDVDISRSDFLLSVGRGVRDKDAVEELGELAARIGATLSVSRPVVDAGWAPPARQVGQSGKTVKPRVYLALGISGAVQHLAGMKSSGTIIAVNTDPQAAIFSVAHYGAVADLFEVAEELAKLY